MKIQFTSRSVVFCLALAACLLLGNASSSSAFAASGGDDYLYLPMISGGRPTSLQKGQPGSCLSAEEMKLAQQINQYRTSNGLPAAPISKSLTMVAQYHVKDLQTYNPNSGTDSRGQTCNLHSWSNHGIWSPVCYTSDHAYAQGMWDKPKEITQGKYTDYGYEIAAAMWGKNITAADALNMWKNSSGHNDVILERNAWSGQRWPAMGIGISDSYAVVWFSSSPDPQGTIGACQ